MMLRHVLNGLAKRTQHFQPNMWMFLCAPGPWHATSGPRAHALVQQCCVNVAKRAQHDSKSRMLHEKFDRFQIGSNIIQHVATYCIRVAKRMQHVVRNNVVRCCVEMLRAFGQALTVLDSTLTFTSEISATRFSRISATQEIAST